MGGLQGFCKGFRRVPGGGNSLEAVGGSEGVIAAAADELLQLIGTRLHAPLQIPYLPLPHAPRFVRPVSSGAQRLL